MNLLEKYSKLADLLYDRTSVGNVQWKWDASLGILSTTLGKTELKIVLNENENSEPVFVITVVYNGKVADRFDDETLRSLMPKALGFTNYFDLLGNIYESGKRQATGADEGLDVALSELEEIIPF